MPKIFPKTKKDNSLSANSPKKQEKVELIDPVLYIGDLDNKKYPFLPLENEQKPEEDVENPLNKR